MCRWAGYIGSPIHLSDILSAPEHSLIEQSRAPDEGKARLNGDGFGIAWYDKRAEPGLYKDVHPAWSDVNLRSFANQVQSHLFLAHVRASTGTAISRNNSHPFVVDNWSFMHNGLVGGFEKVRKKADMLIPDALYKHRKGATDSEAFFLNALGQGLEYDPKRAIAETVKVFEQLSPITPHLRLSIAFSDGKKLYAVRYASDRWAPSIYYRRYKQNDSRAIASEPFDENHNGWTRMKSNSFCIFDKKEVIIQTLI